MDHTGGFTLMHLYVGIGTNVNKAEQPDAHPIESDVVWMDDIHVWMHIEI